MRPRGSIPGPPTKVMCQAIRKVLGHGACSFNSIHGEGAGDRANRTCIHHRFNCSLVDAYIGSRHIHQALAPRKSNRRSSR